MRRVILGTFAPLVLTLALTAPANAQVHMQLAGGMTSAADRQPFLGAGLGFRIGFFEIDVEGGRMMDILPKGILAQLNDLQRERNLPITAIAIMPANYALGTVRFISPAGPIRPFINGGAGVARVEPKFKVVVADISLGDVFGLTSFEPRTVPMAAAGGGVRFDIGRSGMIDIGYRYVRLFTDFRPLLDFDNNGVLTSVNTVYVAFGTRF